jgi:hypothetical protein
MKRDKFFAAVCAGALCAFGGAAEIPVEWGMNWPVDVPYEICVNTAKLARAGYAAPWSVMADGGNGATALPVAVLEGDHDGEVRLHFNMPAGTKRITIKDAARAGRAPYRGEENVFAGALAAGGWNCPEGASVAAGAGGLVLFYPEKGRPLISRRVALPRSCAGKPVRIEIDVKGLSGECIPMRMWLSQFDAQGAELPENVNFGFSTSCMLPPGKAVPFRVSGRLHPQAASVQVNVQSAAGRQRADRYGRLLKDSVVRPRIGLSRLSMRVAADIPFPRLDASLFSAGVSGKPGDEALTLDNDRAFWFNTRSSASWAKNFNVTNCTEVFYPMKDGTVEAWFRPAEKQAGETVRLFDAASQHTKVGFLPFANRDVCSLMSLDWRPADGTLALTMRPRKWVAGRAGEIVPDCATKASGTAEIVADEWNHVAVTFTPREKARVFVNGRMAIEMPIPDYAGFDLSGKKPNQEGPWEFYVGSSMVAARFEAQGVRALNRRVFFTGTVDGVRVSSGIRYAGAFTPSRVFTMDASTRALFTFDRTFDGASSGGIGFIPGTFRCPKDVRTHEIPAASGGVFAYYPEVLSADRDPAKVLDRDNFQDLPSDDDFAAARRAVVQDRDVRPGGEIRINAPEGLLMDWVEIANTGAEPLAKPIVLNAGEVDVRSWGDFADTLGVGSGSSLSDREKADRIFAWLIEKNDYFIDHAAHFVHGGDAPYNPEFHVIRQLISYGRFECGPLNQLMHNACCVGAGIPSSGVYGYGHGYMQVFYGGESHIYDLSARTFFPSMDNEGAASLESANDWPTPFFRAGGTPAYYLRLASRSFGGFRYPLQPPRAGLVLRTGERLRMFRANAGLVNDLMTMGEVNDVALWRNAPKEVYNAQCGTKAKKPVWRIDRFLPDYGNSVLALDWKADDSPSPFDAVSPDSFDYRISSPHPVVAADYGAWRKDGRPVPLSISTNGGKTFRRLPLSADGRAHLTYLVRGREGYRIRAEAPLADVARFRARTVFQNNPRVLTGELKPGANVLSFKADGGDAARVSFGYRVPAGRVDTPDAVSFGAIPGMETHLVVRDGAPAGFTRETRRSPEGGEKNVTVLTAPGARLIVRPQSLAAVGDTVRFPCDLPAGRYAVMVLERYASHEPLPYAPHVVIDVPGAPVECSRPINDAVMLHKQEYGREGGRGLWKWDFPIKGGYPFHQMAEVELPATKELSFRLTEALHKGPLEIKAVLVLPWPERELRCEILKRLCGLRTTMMHEDVGL